jgi:glycosyltransferase involved in cell wall biosynthesis
MPVWNGARWLERALSSLITQTWTDLEIIVVDDGSIDATPQVVTAFAARDARVAPVRREHAGFSAAANAGIAAARGEYIGRLDADDIALPDRFARQVAYMDAHPEVGVVGGALVYIDEHDRKLRRARFPTERIDTEMLKYSALAHPTTLIRRSILDSIGGYRPAFLHAEDYDLWLRIAEHARLANLPYTVTYYRYHTGQVSAVHARHQAGCALVARELALMRRAGRADLVTPDTTIGPETLAALGIEPGRIPALAAHFEQSGAKADRRFLDKAV